MPDTTSPRDELVTLLEQHEGYDCICGEWSGSYPERHLADVLLAAGWTRPEPDWCPCVSGRPQDCKPEDWPRSRRHGTISPESDEDVIRQAKAEALREFADWWGAGQWADWFMTERVVDDMTAVQAMCKALNDAADRIGGE